MLPTQHGGIGGASTPRLSGDTSSQNRWVPVHVCQIVRDVKAGCGGCSAIGHMKGGFDGRPRENIHLDPRPAASAPTK